MANIADVITHAKFCDNRFRGFGVLIPPILPFYIGMAGRPYNSVSTTVLHHDSTFSGDFDGFVAVDPNSCTEQLLAVMRNI